MFKDAKKNNKRTNKGNTYWYLGDINEQLCEKLSLYCLLLLLSTQIVYIINTNKITKSTVFLKSHLILLIYAKCVLNSVSVYS